MYRTIYRELVLLVALSSFLLCAHADNSTAESGSVKALFANQRFKNQDAIIVVDSAGHVLYQHQPEKQLIPASLTKLLTAYFALQKWGADHRFVTEFYLLADQLWVKGLGDPYLVSEELDLIADELNPLLTGDIKSIHIDSSMIAQEPIPGRTQVADPYNAPLSAVAANFNTVMLQRKAGKIVSGEPQTPLTPTSRAVVATWPEQLSAKPNRVNLIDVHHAQKHFAELLLRKLNQSRAVKPAFTLNNIEINQSLPASAQLILRHRNSRPLTEVLRGALEYSNNFIANQLFLLLASEQAIEDQQSKAQVNFSEAQKYLAKQLQGIFKEQVPTIYDGAGLTRKNRISAAQVSVVLDKLRPHKELLKHYPLTGSSRLAIGAHAKTGTLDGVESFAGFLQLGQTEYRFVFIFNRKTPFRYREQLLQTLADQLSSL